MTRTALWILVGACFAGGGRVSHADPVVFQVDNLSLSGGDPVYPVASDVTLDGLQLTEHFSDGSAANVPLLDSAGTPRTSLDTGVVFLDSAVVAVPDPVHGMPTDVTLTGMLDDPTLDVHTSFGADTMMVTARPSLTATLSKPGANASVTLDATDAMAAATYSVGRLSMLAAGMAGPVMPSPPFLRGDVNGDGKITVADATLILRTAVGLTSGLTAAQIDAADVNGDGVVDIADATTVLRLALGL